MVTAAAVEPQRVMAAAAVMVQPVDWLIPLEEKRAPVVEAAGAAEPLRAMVAQAAMAAKVELVLPERQVMVETVVLVEAWCWPVTAVRGVKAATVKVALPAGAVPVATVAPEVRAEATLETAVRVVPVVLVTNPTS